MRTLRHESIKWLTQDHTSKWRRRDLNAHTLTPEPMGLAEILGKSEDWALEQITGMTI